MSFAVVDRDRQGIGAILVILDERNEADSMAIELRRAGIKAEVRALPNDGHPTRLAG
jgi:hypothetical protein